MSQPRYKSKKQQIYPSHKAEHPPKITYNKAIPTATTAPIINPPISFTLSAPFATCSGGGADVPGVFPVGEATPVPVPVPVPLAVLPVGFAEPEADPSEESQVAVDSSELELLVLLLPVVAVELAEVADAEEAELC